MKRGSCGPYPACGECPAWDCKDTEPAATDKQTPPEFSKWLVRQESAQIWIITLAYIGLAYLAVLRGYLGSLPWLTALPTVAWAAYGVSQGFYYNKAKAENTAGGITYAAAAANNYERDL